MTSITAPGENEYHPVRWPRLVLVGVAAVPAALGITGLVTWWFTPHVDPDSAIPLQPGAAAGLLLLGGGGVAFGLRRRVWAVVCAGGALLAGTQSLLQDLGVDRLLREPPDPEAALEAHRMAPNTALSLVLASVTLMLLGRSRRTTLSSMVPAILASMIVGLAAVALAGYAMGLEGMYTWAEQAPMALRTTVGFLLVGAGLCVQASVPSTPRSRAPPWLPVPVAVGGLTATVCVWLTLTEARSGVVEWLRTVVLRQNNFVDANLPELALIAGVAIVLLLTLAIYLGQKVSSRTAERMRALEQLRRARDELEHRVERRTMEIASVNGELQDEIASRKRLEKALRERAKLLADADRKKDEFLAMLGHELRNPLAALSLGLETMELTDPDDPAFARTRKVMNERLHHIVRLVDDLLDVARIRSGKITLRRTTLDLRVVVSTAARSLGPLARGRGHTISVSVPRDAVWVEADAARLEQIIANLVSNAIKYTERSGTVHVTAARENGSAVLRVTDTGIGIPREVLPRMFDGTFDLSLDREGVGLGLGLTFVRRLVRLHEGTVEVFSEGPGRGSEFVVRLPSSAAPTAEAIETEARTAVELAARKSSPRRVLIVDDREDLVVMLKRLLEAWGHEVLAANDGPAALEVASKARPDVALIDIGLPGMSGYDLAGRLRARTGEETLLVAVTGYGQPDHRRRTRQAGFDHHLVKPVDLNVLRDIVEGASP